MVVVNYRINICGMVENDVTEPCVLLCNALVTVNHSLFLLPFRAVIPPATYMLPGAEKQPTHDANEMELYALHFV